jgi:hypothetical protein
MRSEIVWMLLQNFHTAAMTIQICFIGLQLYDISQGHVGRYTGVAIVCAFIGFLISLSCWLGATDRLYINPE